MRVSSPWALAGCALFLCLVAYVDVVTPPGLALSYLYALPVLAATWFVGRRAGCWFVGLTLVLWTLAEIHDPTNIENRAIPIINVATRVFTLMSAVLLLSSFKNLSTRLGIMVEERTEALRQMATRLAEAEDSERRRLATDLHDGLSQMLSLLKLNLSAAVSEYPSESAAANRVQSSIGIVNQLIHTSRTLMFDLHPAMLDHLGLVPTLRQFGEEFSRQAALEITINEEGTPRSLDVSVAQHLFRSAKELMSNAARHGHARQIVISVHWMADSLRVLVDDDGSGFDSTRPVAPDGSKGLGLPSINERVRSLGGSMSIESSTRSGTRVALEVPLTPKESQT